MLTSDVHPDHEGDPTHALNMAHHYHGPTTPGDDFGLECDTCGLIPDELAGGCRRADCP